MEGPIQPPCVCHLWVSGPQKTSVFQLMCYLFPEKGRSQKQNRQTLFPQGLLSSGDKSNKTTHTLCGASITKAENPGVGAAMTEKEGRAVPALKGLGAWPPQGRLAQTECAPCGRAQAQRTVPEVDTQGGMVSCCQPAFRVSCLLRFNFYVLLIFLLLDIRQRLSTFTPNTTWSLDPGTNTFLPADRKSMILFRESEL